VKKIIITLLTFFGLLSNAKESKVLEYELNYANLILLDAENLSELGIKEAYKEIIPLLEKYIENTIQIIEKIDSDTMHYSIQ